jgi:hypothetical protein
VSPANPAYTVDELSFQVQDVSFCVFSFFGTDCGKRRREGGAGSVEGWRGGLE